MEENKSFKNHNRHGFGRMHGGTGEKAKDFKLAIKRLIKELKPFKVLVIIGLIAAVLSSILSILAPNRLSDLTDEISKGLVVKSDNLQYLATTVSTNYSKGYIEDIEIDGTTISSDDQIKFMDILSTMDLSSENIDVNELYQKIDEMAESVQDVVKPFMDVDKIKIICLFLVGLYLFSALCSFAESILMTHVANNFARSLRNRISVKINKLPLKYFDKHQTGDILSRVTNHVDLVAQSMNQSLASLVSSIVLFLGTIIMMFITNWIMAITAILASLLGFVGMSFILKRSQKYFLARQTELGNLNGQIEEVYSSLNVVKAYNGKKEVDKKFDELNKKVYVANSRSQFLSGLMQPLMTFIGNFGYVAVCIVGALLTMNGTISFGVIVAFMTYVRLFTSPLSQIAQGMTMLQSTAAASERVFEFLDEKEMPSQENIKKSLNKDKVKGNIEFNHVVFQYEDSDKPTIKDFSASAKPGQKIAIVGPTGARKNYNGKFTYEIL